MNDTLDLNVANVALVPATVAAPTGAPVDTAQPIDPTASKVIKADPLSKFLEKNNARLLWTAQQPGVTVSCYSILGTVVIATVFAGRNRAGWELYIPAAKSNKVDDTLQAAAAFIGNGCQV